MAPQEYKEYPRWLYHATEPATKVADAEAHQLLGTGWHVSPVDVQAAEVEKQAAAAAEAEATERVEAEKRDLYATPVAAVIERLKGCSLETLAKVKAYELANKTPRKSLLEALEQAIASRA